MFFRFNALRQLTAACIAALLSACGHAAPLVAAPVPVDDTPPLAAPRFRAPLVHHVGDALSIRTGFVPDPVVIVGETVRDAPLTGLDASCAGLATEAPTQRIRMETRFGFLRLFATGPEDLTLAVRTQDGAILCSDDRFGRHPSIEGRFPPGELEVWVGVKPPVPVAPPADAPDASPEPAVAEAETVAPEAEGAHGYALELTETRSVRPGVRSGEDQDHLSLAIELGLDVRTETGQGPSLRLRRGFLPDPRSLEGSLAEATTRDVSGLETHCAGFVAAMPSHVITLQEDFDYFQVYVADAPEDSVLIVLGPDGSLFCDSSDNDQPQVEASAWPAGVYRVWVGALREDAVFPYRVGVSEIRRAR